MKKLVVIKKEKVSSSILDCLDDDTLFLEVGTGKIFFLNLFDYNMDGIFKNIASWKRFVNKIDSDGVSFLLRRGYINKKFFKTLKYATKIGNNEYIQINFKGLNFDFNYEYLWYKNQNFNEAGIIELYVDISIK